MRLPPLKSLQVFLAAAQQQSFKCAAEQLHVTQAAVSQQIRLLERFFDTPLFDRENNQTRLNAKGQLLFPYIEKAFEQMTLGVNAVISEPNPFSLRISALHSVTSLLLVPKISDFQQQNPDLNVQFSPNNKLDLFQGDGVDIAIRRGLGQYPGLESHKLIDDAIVLVASPLLLSTIKQELNAIFSLPLLEDISSDIQEAITACCSTFGINKAQLHIKLSTTDALPIVQQALAGQGIAFVSKVLVKQYIKQGQLVNVLDYAYDNPRTLYLVAPPHHFLWPKVKRFEKWLRAAFAAL
ncbi:LysR family transcriptional regulator [Thalassotalea insulae]|uniref:LysR family transcriptional regulator n=1 Tax=Thalassotalea insulae TaxID=2056778 RepID=A0ABQ6GRA2_9GAMM|nr:LysR substrate-binding domain-containing protein [Thalassotalea insulae]GLX77117.1 LysR family transcriptional regulator [Thalassotalea insulae]